MNAAVIQMNSTGDRRANLEQARGLLFRAASQGAELAVLPEHFAFLQAEGRPFERPEALRGALLQWLAGQARQLKMWILGGSFATRRPGKRRVFNTSPLLDDQGRLVAWYHKIHLFDLTEPGRPALVESATTCPGRRLVVADTPLGRLGLSICYDLRFPELYRRLRLMGAQVLAAPSAFTKATGQYHWELLVRTRAVENQCYLLAAAQVGRHAPGREGYGQAMIVDPWGEILAQCGTEEPEVVLARVEPRRVEQVRARLDSTAHARLLPRGWFRKGE